MKCDTLFSVWGVIGVQYYWIYGVISIFDCVSEEDIYCTTSCHLQLILSRPRQPRLFYFARLSLKVGVQGCFVWCYIFLWNRSTTFLQSLALSILYFEVAFSVSYWWWQNMCFLVGPLVGSLVAMCVSWWAPWWAPWLRCMPLA